VPTCVGVPDIVAVLVEKLKPGGKLETATVRTGVDVLVVVMVYEKA